MRTAIALLALLLPVSASASLIDRGGGLIYDDVLNVTWLQDANYAKTSGYHADGLMTWDEAKGWAGQLVYGGYNDWRLASNSPVGTDWNYNYVLNGTTDVGHNITSPHSELSYMYYVNLGLKGYWSTSGDYQPDFGIFGNGTFNGTDTSSLGQNDVGLIDNLQASFYWSGTEYAPDPWDAWFFNLYHGYQFASVHDNDFYAWAVRDGDVSPVPLPGTLPLMASGLVALAVFIRKR